MKATKLPARSRAEALRYLEQHPQPGLFVLQMAHDDFCPAIQSQRDADCDSKRCKPDFYLIPVGQMSGGRHN